jgi:hypothetical protein
MNYDPETRKEERRQKIHAGYDYAMGSLWLCTGLFFLLHNRFGIELKNFDTTLTWIFGGACIAYGLFRLYRAYKKNY